MYKRDRARRLQIMRQRQMVRTGVGSHGSGGGGGHSSNHSLGEVGSSSLAMIASNSNGGLSGGSIYTPDGIKQELIQIPQLSSSTSSPDSSPTSVPTTLTSSGRCYSANRSQKTLVLTQNSSSSLLFFYYFQIYHFIQLSSLLLFYLYKPFLFLSLFQ